MNIRYIAFDIECSQSYGNYSPISNFGYVILDESFNVVEKRVIIINPKAKFKLKNRKNRKDLDMVYDINVYKKAPSFKFYYRFIKELLEYPNQIIFNHVVKNYIEFLLNDCLRYNLDLISF